MNLKPDLIGLTPLPQNINRIKPSYVALSKVSYILLPTNLVSAVLCCDEHLTKHKD
jgi:hypothetical protein